MMGLFLFLMKIGLYILPKNKKSIYMKQSMPYKDNISACLDEMINSGIISKYKIYLHGETLKSYQSSNIHVVKPNSFSSVWHYIRSKYVLCDNGLYGSIYTPRQITVNMTHGMMCKTFGYLTKDSFSERKKYKFLPHRTSTNVVSSSDFFVSAWSKALGVPEENVLVTGLPRNDYLINNIEKCNLYNQICKENEKSIIWMPTYRTSSSALSQRDGAQYELGIPLLTRDNIRFLDQFLKEKKVKLVIKYHTLQDNEKNDIGKLKNIIFIDSDDIIKEQIALYSFLKCFDALITDYSSVYFDYLLLDRPICHIVDDYDEYSRTRGFAFPDTINLLPGELVYSFDDLKEFIDSIASENDRGKDKRQHLSTLLLKYFDGNNSKRLLESVGIK